MNIHASPKKNPSRAPETGDVTVGPRMGGKKIYEPGVLFPHIRVPHRRRPGLPRRPRACGGPRHGLVGTVKPA